MQEVGQMILIEQLVGFLMTVREIAGLVILSIFERSLEPSQAPAGGGAAE
jgi:hypothetical protein